MNRFILGFEKRSKELTAKGRNQIDDSNFALPGRRYPIHDARHARNALARVAQHGTADEQKTVKAKVHARYPGIGKEAEEKTQTKTKTVAKMIAGGVAGGMAGAGAGAGLAKHLGKGNVMLPIAGSLLGKGIGSAAMFPHHHDKTAGVRYLEWLDKLAKEQIPGGKSEGIDKKKFDKREVETGQKIEMEHTDKPAVAREIARDHLAETGKERAGKIKSPYYRDLPAFERRVEHEA